MISSEKYLVRIIKQCIDGMNGNAAAIYDSPEVSVSEGFNRGMYAAYINAANSLQACLKLYERKLATPMSEDL
jgi:hypothetical protein